LPATSPVFVFPAFPNDYTGHPGNDLEGFSIQFEQLIKEVSTSHEFLLSGFNFQSNNFLDDELKTQYITYLYSCAAATVLRKKQIHPEYSAGYSMGIYAALYDAGSITLDTGLRFIKQAYRSLKSAIRWKTYGMGTLIGLERKDIEMLISNSHFRIDITNQNAPYSYVVSGIRDDIQEMLSLAKNEGALHTRSFPVSVPFHNHLLKDAAIGFSGKTSHLDIFPPSNPVLSLIDQKELHTPEELRCEITRNLHHPLNWYKTQQWFVMHGIQQFIECGPSRGLVKNAKFVGLECRFIPLDGIH